MAAWNVEDVHHAEYKRKARRNEEEKTGIGKPV